MTTIAHVDAESGFSGGEVQVFLLMEGLRERGFENVIVCPPHSGSEAEAGRRAFPSIRVSMRNDLDLLAVLRLARRLRAAEVDLVHLHTGRATWLGGLASLVAGVPSLSTRRMDRRVRRGWRTGLIYGRCVEHTVAISPAVERCLLEPGVPAERISVIWDAVDPDGLAPERTTRDLRAEAGLGRDDALVLVLAALVRRKGIDVLLEALERLHARGCRAHAWIAGEGPEREALEAQASRAGLAGHVRFLGWRSDKAELLAAADCFVLPSRREGVGVAALEAMASGVAVVASRVGGLCQVVVDGTTGMLVEPEDPDALAGALEHLLADSNRRAQYGLAGACRVREHFSAETMVENYVAVYERVLRSSARQRAR